MHRGIHRLGSSSAGLVAPLGVGRRPPSMGLPLRAPWSGLAGERLDGTLDVVDGNPEIFVVIPAFNEANTLQAVLRELNARYHSVVVDVVRVDH